MIFRQKTLHILLSAFMARRPQFFLEHKGFYKKFIDCY